MKNNKKIITIVLAVGVLSVSSSAFLIITNASQPDWWAQKQSVTAMHNDKLNEAKQNVDAHAQQHTAEMDARASSMAAEAQKNPIFTQTGIISATNDGEYAMSAEDQNKIEFTTQGFGPYDIVVVGVSKEDANQGIIFDFHVDPKTSKDSRDLIHLDGYGKLTLTDINGNLFYFKSDSGKIGVYDVINHKVK